MINVVKKLLLERNIFFLLTLFFLPFSIGVSSITLGISFVYCVIAQLKNKKKLSLPIKCYVVLCIMFFVYLMVLTFFNSPEGAIPFDYLLKYAPLIFMPFYGLSLDGTNNKNHQILNVGFICLICGIIVSMLVGLVNFISHDLSYNYSNIEAIFGVHPAYLSLFILICINHLISQNEIPNVYRLGIILLFIVSLILLRSRTSMLVMIILLTYHSLFYWKNIYLKYIFLLSGFILTSITIIYINSVDGTKTTFMLAINERLQIWGSAFQLFLNSPFFGYGVNQEYIKLSEMYFIQGKFNLLDNKYNSHNIILSGLLQYGVIGLSVVMSIFIFPLLGKVKRVDYIGFLLIILLCGFTESYMYRHWGVILFLICGIYVDMSFKKTIII